MPIPVRMQRVIDDFAGAPPSLRVELLVEYAAHVVPPPTEVATEPGRLERVTECRAPVWLATGLTDDGRVILWFDAVPEAATTLGYLGALTAGLTGATVAEVRAVEPGVHRALGLEELLTPLRVQGMDAILARLQRRLAPAAPDA